MPLRIAVLVKHVPVFEELDLDEHGRLRRDGTPAEMNPYCRRAVAQGVLLAKEHGGTTTVFTLGPPAAADALREAVAWGIDSAVHVTGPEFAGSDTLATTRALSAALLREGPFDLVLVGRNSVDADTGQTPAQLAESLGLPLMPAVRELGLTGRVVEAVGELDDGTQSLTAALPVVVSCAERLCAPAKMPVDQRELVPPERIKTLGAADLGHGPWGQQGSPTWVERSERIAVDRSRRRLTGPLHEQVADAVAALADSGALDGREATNLRAVPPSRPADGPAGVVVVIEPGGLDAALELLGEAALLASRLGTHVAAFRVAQDGPDAAALGRIGSAGADELVTVPVTAPEDAAAALADWTVAQRPAVVLLVSTTWGREVAGRAAFRAGCGLTGDAVGLGVEDGRLTAWKPAFAGGLLAAVRSSSPTEMATVRPGVLGQWLARPAGPMPETRLAGPDRSLVVRAPARRTDDAAALAQATAVVGIGAGVRPDEQDRLRPLLDVLGAELAASRKVTDQGGLPRSRQIGITGRSIAPALYVAVATSGKFNHMAGVRGAGFVLAINDDPAAPVYDHADLGIVGDWREAVDLVAAAIARQRAEASARA